MVNSAAQAGTSGRADILALGFGTTVAMWAVGYVLRLPPAAAPAWLLIALMLVCQLVGGLVAGRYSARGWRAGPYACLLSSFLNLLILGSLLTGERPNQVVPSALWWIPGSLAVAGLLGAIGGVLGAGWRRPTGAAPDWLGGFGKVAAVATLLLLIAGGLVTGKEAGLAVVDWPNSFGYNMFLYPLSRMAGGIYFEHAHRLFGSLVGLTTLVLAIWVQRADRPKWLKGFAWCAFATVVVQGILGGLRVTGKFTLTTSPEEVAPSIRLAIVHGVLGQVIFAMVVALAVFLSSSWNSVRAPVTRAGAAVDRVLNPLLVVLLVVQLVFGAILRHVAGGLLIHISMAVAVLLVALACGVRAWGLYDDQPALRRLGRLMIMGITVQVGLGIAALIAVGATAGVEPRPAWDVVLTTIHQAFGALLLALAVTLTLWMFALVQPAAPRPMQP